MNESDFFKDKEEKGIDLFRDWLELLNKHMYLFKGEDQIDFAMYLIMFPTKMLVDILGQEEGMKIAKQAIDLLERGNE